MWSSKKNTIQVFFVLTEDKTDIENMSETMQLAFHDCNNHELTTNVISESDVCSMKSLKKSQVFVYENFEGPAFRHVLMAAKQNKAVIVSPICLRTCFIEAISIPENNSPIYTMAMRDIVLSISNLSPKEKERVKEKVERMGGIFSHNLRDSTTHLMVGKAGSTKHIKAIENGINIMTEEWVDAVWEESLICNIVATETKFDKYKCPPFYKLEITTSGLEGKDREKLITLIDANGGKYTPQMKKDETNILIIMKPTGQKFTYAQQWGLLCLKPSWIYDSVQKGYIIDTQDYIVKNSMLSSTPASSNVKPNFSQNDISGIVAEPKSTIEETINNCEMLKRQKINNHRSQENCTTPKKNNGQYHSKQINYRDILNDLSLAEVKKAGTILDGCKIYFSGFTLSEEEKLKRIVISTGGIRYTELNASITHIVVGDFSASLAKLLHSIQEKPHVVSFNWLLESINLKCTAPEDQFLAMDSSHSFTPESPSPLSKKGLYMMKNSTLSQPKVVDKPKLQTSSTNNPPLDNFIDQYLNVETTNFDDTQSEKSSCTTQDTMSTQDSKLESVLEGLTILLHDLDSHQLPSIKSKIISMGGVAVNTRSYRGKINYVVVPIVFNEKSLSINATIVSCLWIEDCYNNVEQIPIEYYHKPVIFSGSTPLKSCVISITNYTGSERYFLKEVSLLLGANFQDALSRKTKPDDNIMMTTHLICSTPEGPKYEASVKWGVPVVSKDWLLKCVTCKRRLPEDKFPIVSNANKSSILDSTFPSSSKVKNDINNDSSTSFTQKLTILAIQENDIDSELAVPLKDTEDDIEPPLKKKCSMEIMVPTSQVLDSPSNKYKPAIARLRSSCSTPVASKSFIENLKTPDTPYGQIFYNDPVTPETKKKWKKWVDTFPDGADELSQPKLKNRNSTPLTELKRQLWNKSLHPQYPHANSNQQEETNEISSMSINSNDTLKSLSLSYHSPGMSKSLHNTSQLSKVQNNKSNTVSPNIDTKQQSLDKQEFRRTIEELQQDLCASREPEIPLSRTESESQDDYARNSLFKERVVESSQQCSVGWEDPTEQQEKARLKRLSECNKKFILTSVNSSDRQKYENAIEKLGAQVLRSAIFCEDVTHVLMHQPSKSEKYLCSLASGKWILHPSYIDDCLEENCFLPEDKYEWGNPLSDLSLSTPLHAAGYRWRSKIRSGKAAAFSGMKAVLLTSENRYQALKRLIQAGGGMVLDKKELLQSTHCIVDQGFGNIPVPLNEIAVKGILLLAAPFLADFLLKDPSPDPKKCLIPEYQAFYNRLAPNT
ncbi:DNA topoisomerase 2-binding protein 1-B isoform X1 [Aphis gossypii]|uniref:DNA topoisomerase 2-binding protein 1-B isoform X1 n=2 Tax=Aphis gossypii TaxID=80765 RepID=UPI002158A593|nr:DNA topoisomerase 2-binding protein 1-B isoform X1 [Aphis gossypii]